MFNPSVGVIHLHLDQPASAHHALVGDDELQMTLTLFTSHSIKAPVLDCWLNGL